ncbi:MULTISPECIES: STY4534 family ICE replication protein [Yersinia]|jgi:hypothetical protein|uniref:STY4534 family ICE replication protein n=1 Tax=Yersinia TaxID=629 RepID=UPI00065CDBC1|nr:MULTISPECIES: STY4534 family ICE replication protein [Yersinia]UYK10049.1 STY4534 family ICE replication protein [Yersinia enterocolitica]CRY82384.1 Protein of uncharacterised function (DUF3577) [Yersinia intermedia]HDL7969644.1 DUF3577 domain-containing protein [Yersinia enterocolitica]HDY4892086.1 DUF3577 domain-containing protein [Yersinia enterocolitica]
MSQTTQSTAVPTQTGYFNLHIDGLGYVSNIREVTTANGSFLSCVVNALHGSTEKPDYTRFDVTVSGKEASGLIRRCQKAVDEEKKVLVGFKLSNLTADVFTLTKGDHAGESRPTLKARLIKISWIKVGQEMVYKAEKSAPTPEASANTQKKQYQDNAF